MKSSMFSRLNSTGSERSFTSASNGWVPTRSTKASNASPSSRSRSYMRIQRSTASGTRFAGRGTFSREPVGRGAVGARAVLVAAADVGHVRRQLPAADLHRRAVEPDRAEVVLRAAVWAAAHLDVEAAGQWVGDVHRRHAALDGAVQAHRARDAELAAVGAG